MKILNYRSLYPKATWKKVVLVASIITLIVPIALIVRVIGVLTDIPAYKEYWQDRLKETPENESIRLVALGDSAAQGIGADSPEEGFVGRIEQYIQQKTGKPVYVANISVTGAKVADVLENQLPRLKDLNPDIIVLSVSGNDANKQIDINGFKEDINKLYSGLPADKTIVSDVPGVDHREQYQPILLEAARKNNLRVAPVYEKFHPHDDEFSSYAGDFFHPSSKGYSYWFEAYRPHVDELIDELNLQKNKTNGS